MADTLGPAEQSIYKAYDAAVQAAFNAFLECIKKNEDVVGKQCLDEFKAAITRAATALTRALGELETLPSAKVPAPKHKSEWF
jgi:hypothetical protein